MSESALKEETTKAVAKRNKTEAAAPVVQSEESALVSMIERLARDPTVNVETVGRFLEMRDKMRAQEAERAFNDAMAKAQAEMLPVSADAYNPQTKSKYASYAALDRALRPIYTKHGFALSFNTLPGAPENYVRVGCSVTNCGHTRPYQMDMPADGKGAKGGDVMTKTHAAGSAASYGMRYLLKMIFNIAVGAEDDDGNKAGNSEPKPLVNEKQVAALQALMKQAEVDKQIIFEHFKVSDLAELTIAQYTTATNKLNKKLGK
jgi:ERF superfamily protein